MNQPQNQNNPADGQSRAGEAGANLTDVFATVDDLAALVARLAHSLRQAAPDNDLPEKAVDYLRRKGLQGSPMRKVANVELSGREEKL